MTQHLGVLLAAVLVGAPSSVAGQEIPADYQAAKGVPAALDGLGKNPGGDRQP
ncbi:MAG TPA: hypothetical protein VES67_20625 [Vicinamibacterales bacterium]|nr:hypothetical protein [Vicinamibacterales bacterium]